MTPLIDEAIEALISQRERKAKERLLDKIVAAFENHYDRQAHDLPEDYLILRYRDLMDD